MNDEILAMLKKLADREIGADADDFMVDDYAGGNIDDAYSMGCDHGEVFLARSLLDKFKAD